MSHLSRGWRVFTLITVLALGAVLFYIVAAKGASVHLARALGTPNEAAVLAAGARYPGLETGQSTYQSQCASCHGKRGKGDGWTAWLFRLKMRDLTEAAYMQTLTDEYLFQIIKHGGASLGKPGMPSWGQELTDREIGDLVAYIRSLGLPPGQSPPSGRPAR